MHEMGLLWQLSDGMMAANAAYDWLHPPGAASLWQAFWYAAEHELLHVGVVAVVTTADVVGVVAARHTVELLLADAMFPQQAAPKYTML